MIIPSIETETMHNYQPTHNHKPQYVIDAETDVIQAGADYNRACEGDDQEVIDILKVVLHDAEVALFKARDRWHLEQAAWLEEIRKADILAEPHLNVARNLRYFNEYGLAGFLKWRNVEIPELEAVAQ